MVEKELVREALENENLRRSIKEALPHFVEKRREAFKDVPLEDWRDRASSVREHVLKNLDSYLNELRESIESWGGQVHFAPRGEDAVKKVLEICKRSGAELIVKSKSMITEEIGLNKHLEKSGFEVVETDLGEFIIQLASEGPSHIIAPAVHKKREEVKKLFEEKLNIEVGDSIEDLTRAARKVLREKFLNAHVGITGVNYAVAKEGVIVIVENEGNVRMVTKLPKVHIAIMSIEKILPRFEHLALFLPLLTRSATGQLLTSYVNLIRGVEEGKEFHLIILDNGRSKILEDDRLWEILKCIRCGACMNHCPVYRNIGGHAYGWVYPGPIGSVLTPSLLGLERWGHLAYYSTLCNKCKEVCPVKIDLPGLLVELRRRLVSERVHKSSPGFLERVFIRTWRGVVTNSSLFKRAVHLGSYLLLPLSKKGWVEKMPLFVWTRSRAFPQPRRRMFRDFWRERWRE